MLEESFEFSTLSLMNHLRRNKFLHLPRELEWHATIKEEVSSVDAFTRRPMAGGQQRPAAFTPDWTRGAPSDFRGSGLASIHPQTPRRPRNTEVHLHNCQKSQHRDHFFSVNIHPRLRDARAWQKLKHTRPSAPPTPSPQNTSSPDHSIISSGDVRSARHPSRAVRRSAEDDEQAIAGLARRGREIRRVCEHAGQYGR